MLVVQPGGGYCCNEELAPIGVGASVGHTQGEGPVMPQAAVKLILEFRSPNGRSSSAVSCKDHANDHPNTGGTFSSMQFAVEPAVKAIRAQSTVDDKALQP